MTIEQATIRDAVVFRDDSNTWRWYDAIGPEVPKWHSHFTSLPTDDTTGDPTEFTMTVVEVGAGTSTAVLDTDAGGHLLLTTAGNEDDGLSLQLKGEAWQLNGDYPTYFGIKLRINDVDQTDFIAGLCITDTALLGGMTDGVYFRSVDGSASVSFVLEKDSVESETTGVSTMTDATWVTLEFYYDGTDITAYVDGTQAVAVADSNASFPNDEVLTLSLEFLTGEATANTMEVDWLRVIQIRN